MNNNYKDELTRIEKTVEEAKLSKARLEERRKKLDEDRTKILEDLKKEGVKEEELQDKVAELEISIEEEITKAKEIIE